MFRALAAALLLAVAATADTYGVIDLKTYGNVTMRFRPDAAPKTVANFIKIAESGYFKNRRFYRLVHNFVLQGGSITANPSTVPLEYKLPNVKNSVALARTPDLHSGSSEFFINLIDNSKTLAPAPTGVAPGGYCVFAEVIDGVSAVARMAKLPTHLSRQTGMQEPIPEPVIEDIRIIRH